MCTFNFNTFSEAVNIVNFLNLLAKPDKRAFLALADTIRKIRTISVEAWFYVNKWDTNARPYILVWCCQCQRHRPTTSYHLWIHNILILYSCIGAKLFRNNTNDCSQIGYNFVNYIILIKSCVWQWHHYDDISESVKAAHLFICYNDSTDIVLVCRVDIVSANVKTLNEWYKFNLRHFLSSDSVLLILNFNRSRLHLCGS